MEKNSGACQIMTPEEFDSLPSERKKVLIAEDILAQLRKGKYLAKDGYAFVHVDFDFAFNNRNEPLRELLLEDKVPQCTVCARGAAFLSTVKFRNQLRVGIIHQARKFDYDENDDDGAGVATEFMDPVFTEKEQKIMEGIFEGWESQDYYDLTNEEVQQAISFHKELIEEWEVHGPALANEYETRGNFLLTHICERIIKNEGKSIL